MYPFEKFTDQAKRALSEAQGDAERWRAGFIGTEHLLVGLLNVGDGLAAMVLARLGWDVATVYQGIDRLTQDATSGSRVQQIIPAARVKKVIELAFEEARRTGSARYVTTGCLLVGILLEGEGPAAQVLREGGVSVEEVRGSLEELTSGGVRETQSDVRVDTAHTNALQRIASAAEKEAAAMGTSVESDHIWRALLREDTFTTRLLTALGVDPAEASRLVTLPDDVVALLDELGEVRADQETALAARRRAEYAVACERAMLLQQTIDERLRRWRETLGGG